MPLLSLTILRISIGLTMLIAHGWPKWVAFSTIALRFPDPFGVGSAASLGLVIFAEIFCSILLILGFGVRAACIPLIITMLVAVFSVHAGDPFAKKELASLYLFAYTTLLVGGRGAFALNVDKYLGNNALVNWLMDKKRPCS